MRSLGDLVYMTVPTQWMPDYASGRRVPLYPNSGLAPNVPGGSSLLPVSPATAIAAGWPSGIPGVPGYTPVMGPLPTSLIPWFREQTLPDSMLPPALRRSNPLLRHVDYQPNPHDGEIIRQALLWCWIARHGGLKSCCRIPELGAPIWDQPPWEVMPSQGQEFRKMFALPLASVSGGGPFDGTDTILGQWRVPIGYDGVLNQFVCSFSGAGFVDFSGDIAWRVLIGNRFAKDLGNITNTFGSYQAAFLVPGYGIRLLSGQTVTFIASIPAGSPVTGPGMVTAGGFGWVYPRR